MFENVVLPLQLMQTSHFKLAICNSCKENSKTDFCFLFLYVVFENLRSHNKKKLTLTLLLKQKDT